MVLQYRSRIHVCVVVLLLVAQTAARTAATAVALTAAAVVFAQAKIAKLDDAGIRDENVLGGKKREQIRKM